MDWFGNFFHRNYASDQTHLKTSNTKNTDSTSDVSMTQDELDRINEQKKVLASDIKNKEAEAQDAEAGITEALDQMTTAVADAQSELDTVTAAADTADSTATTAEGTAQALANFATYYEPKETVNYDENGEVIGTEINPEYIAAKAAAAAAQAQAAQLREQANQLRDQQEAAAKTCAEIANELAQLEEDKEGLTEEQQTELDELKQQAQELDQQAKDIKEEIENEKQEQQQQEPDGQVYSITYDEEGNLVADDGCGNVTTYEFAKHKNGRIALTEDGKATLTGTKIEDKNSNTTTDVTAAEGILYINEENKQDNTTCYIGADKQGEALTVVTNLKTGVTASIDAKGEVTYEDENHNKLDAKAVREKKKAAEAKEEQSAQAADEGATIAEAKKAEEENALTAGKINQVYTKKAIGSSENSSLKYSNYTNEDFSLKNLYTTFKNKSLNILGINKEMSVQLCGAEVIPVNSEENNDTIINDLSNLQEDIKPSEAVENGTQLINDIKNAENEDEVYEAILTKCENNEKVAEKIFNYLMENKPENAKGSNPYFERSNIYLTNLLYSNNGDKLVLNENVLNLFTQTTEILDINGEEREMPLKEYYVNYTGEICSIDYEYHEKEEDRTEYITMKFNEGDATSEISFYETQNEYGETFYHTLDSDGKDKTIENQEEFLKRLVVTKNYTQDISNSDLTTEEVNERYTVLKKHDDNIAITISALIKEKQNQGGFDELYEEFKKITGFGLTLEELGIELDKTAGYSKIMMNAVDGNIDKAASLAEKEFDRRLQSITKTNGTWQDVYEELNAYYQDEKIALDIMNGNAVSSDFATVTLNDEGKVIVTVTDSQGQTASFAGDDKTLGAYRGNLSLEKVKKYGNSEVENYKLDSKDTIYKFLYIGGEYTQDNADSFNEAKNKFTQYNIAIAHGEALQQCKTPEEAFYVITGKNVNDKENITDDDIDLFNSYYALNNESKPTTFVDEANGIEHIYKLEIQYNKEKQDFDIKYQEYNQNPLSLEYEPKGKPKNEIPDYDKYNRDNKNLFQLFNASGNVDKLQQEKFSEFYDNNSDYINNCIENYADWAFNNEDTKKHFKKALGKEPQNVDEIINYLKGDGLYSESANYIQYDYTTKKQTLMGETKLDELTSDYCTDMATYASKLSHGLTMGFLMASVFIPLAAPAAKAVSILARASGFVDNFIDLANMSSNDQNYLDDNYAGWAKSTAFEAFTKQGYRYFSGLAQQGSDKFLPWLIENTGGSYSVFANGSLAGILAKGTFEALYETGIALPFTAVMKNVQGGEYNLIEELKENFFFDFLPYAKGWQNMVLASALKDGIDNDADKLFQNSSGKYYTAESDSNTRIYVDNNGNPVGIVEIKNGNKVIKAAYEYSDDNNYKVNYYDNDGKIESSTVVENGGKKMTWLDEDGNFEISKINESKADGSIVTKYFQDGSNTPKLTETRDAKGNLISAESPEIKETFDKAGRCVEIIQKGADGDNTIKYTYENGVGYGILKTSTGKEVELTKYPNGTIKYIDDDGKEVEIKNESEYRRRIDSNTIPQDTFWEDNPEMDYLRYLIFLDAGAYELIDDARYSIDAKAASSQTDFDYNGIQKLGIENLTIATNQKGVRGSSIFAKPNKKFISKLNELGIEQVIDLRAECNQDKCTAQCANNGLEYTSFPIYYNKKLTEEEINTTKESLPKFISAINKGNFYIGCCEGTNRTDVAFGINYLFNPEETVIPEFESKSPNKSLQMTKQILNAITNKNANGNYEVTDEFAKSLGWKNASELEKALTARVEQLLKVNTK